MPKWFNAFYSLLCLKVVYEGYALLKTISLLLNGVLDNAPAALADAITRFILLGLPAIWIVVCIAQRKYIRTILALVLALLLAVAMPPTWGQTLYLCSIPFLLLHKPSKAYLKRSKDEPSTIRIPAKKARM
ncbi:hypothetical protein [Paenibacillus xylanilyticus]|uniref:hypothetical protein n=1 Tax=Paenibacillus xylanilyticus TaxID=248903 RepID=UPI0039A07609